jgi:hypothetical protein
MALDGRYADAVTLGREGLEHNLTRSGAYVLMRQNLALLGRFEEMIALGKTFGAGTQVQHADAETAVDSVIVPLETKPLEVVLLARFLGSHKDTAALPATDAVVYAPDALAPLLERVDSGRRVLPLSGADIARPGAMPWMSGCSTIRRSDLRPISMWIAAPTISGADRWRPSSGRFSASHGPNFRRRHGSTT